MNRPLKINFVGNFQRGYVGEVADETHLARELERLGHTVKKIPRDIWKAYTDGENPNEDWVLPMDKVDINIIAKWHHFTDGSYCRILKTLTEAPVFYWTWDYMDWPTPPEWHRRMAEGSDLHLTNEGGMEEMEYMKTWKIKSYYFPFDVSDGDLPYGSVRESDKKYDVTFFGSCIAQGDRKEWIPEISKKHRITAFSWNYEDWKKLGIDAYPAVYGAEFTEKVLESKICLQMSVYDHCWGYWSNRVGKILTTGGFLLARYTPGMELFLRDGAEYFSSIKEACEKIEYYLSNAGERDRIAVRGKNIGRERFTSQARIKDLEILIYRYLNGGLNGWSLRGESL